MRVPEKEMAPLAALDCLQERGQQVAVWGTPQGALWGGLREGRSR